MKETCTPSRLALILFMTLHSIHSSAEMIPETRQLERLEAGPGIEYSALIALATLKPRNSNVVQDYKIYDLRVAAEEGNPMAMHDLAAYLRTGIGVEKNLDEAFRWYKKSAETGFAGAQNNLGDMHESGDGIPQSYSDAIYWYTQAAMGGEATAYLSLGNMFSNGLGVQKDLVESYFWFTMAIKHLTAKSNLQSAKLQRDKIEKVMTDHEISRAQNKANNFLPLVQTEYALGDPLKE